MSRFDLISSFVFLSFSILVTLLSLRLSTGTFGNPGPGLFPTITGILLTMTSGILFVQSYLRFRSKKKEILGADKRLWHVKPAATVIIMFVYAVTIDRLGFITTSLILLFFLYKVIGDLSVKVSLSGSILTTAITYLLFKVWLNVQLPTGPFGV